MSPRINNNIKKLPPLAHNTGGEKKNKFVTLILTSRYSFKFKEAENLCTAMDPALQLQLMDGAERT